MPRLATRLLVALTLVATTTAIAPTAQADPPTEITKGEGQLGIGLKNAAVIVTTKWGYRYQAGQQHNRLTVSVVDGRVLFVDPRTKKIKRMPKLCSKQKVSKGISISCKVPKRFKSAKEMFLEIWPRLGDDYIDGSALPAKYRLWAITDAGNDTVFGGAADDFVNGAQDDDEAHGGDGDDWIRTGIGDDELWGDGGDDELVGVDGKDEIHGGDGTDLLGGGPGNDTFFSDDLVEDILRCGDGDDHATVDLLLDRLVDCETAVPPVVPKLG